MYHRRIRHEERRRSSGFVEFPGCLIFEVLAAVGGACVSTGSEVLAAVRAYICIANSAIGNAA